MKKIRRVRKCISAYAYPTIAMLILSSLGLLMLAGAWKAVSPILGNEVAAAWFQAVFSVTAIAAAIFVAKWQSEESRRIARDQVRESRRISKESADTSRALALFQWAQTDKRHSDAVALSKETKFRCVLSMCEYVQLSLDTSMRNFNEKTSYAFNRAAQRRLATSSEAFGCLPLFEVPDPDLVKDIVQLIPALNSLVSEMETISKIYRECEPAEEEKLCYSRTSFSNIHKRSDRLVKNCIARCKNYLQIVSDQVATIPQTTPPNPQPAPTP